MTENAAELMQALYGEHAESLWRFALKLTGDRAVAQEVVQETMLRAWQHQEILDQSERTARPWLFTVARNIVIDRSRSHDFRQELLTAEAPERAVRDEVDSILDIMLLDAALGQLCPTQRQVIRVRYLDGLSTRAASEHLGMPEGTVKSRLHDALQALKEILIEMGVR